MSNSLVFFMVIPIVVGIILIFFRESPKLQSWASIGVVTALFGLGLYLLQEVRTQGILRLDFGGWEPPFGILFVADTFSLLLILTTLLVTIICLLYVALSPRDRMINYYFYPLVLFLNAGIIGSYLTGDIFNLFVCFEVMLLSSYVLITLGGNRIQLREAMKYVTINIVSSWFFLVGIAFLYGSVGTLNMAHIAQRVAESGSDPLLTVVSIVFLTVFSLKAGLLLYVWLPGSYSSTPTVTSALFGALLTKVGVYALFRVFTLIFNEGTLLPTFIAIMAGLTLIGGSLGAVAYTDIRKIAAYNVVIAVGFMLAGLSIGNTLAIEGTIFYILHDMFAKALLFLLIGTMIFLTNKVHIHEMSGLLKNYPTLGWTFFIVVLSLAGIPPFSGFMGKLLVIEGALENGSYVLLALAIASSLAVLYSLLRIFSQCFWGETIISAEEQRPLPVMRLLPLVVLAGITLALGLGVEVVAPYVQAAASLLDPSTYINAVLGGT
ncbi:Na+/H+ antiporter subunit D [Chryseomicrobium excrementi]|uniref:Na+/H+ antiporter subunit D n=1 Tax=Chryseomicrobium excrementi TaxID=2041346 RepID=A0A2M9EZK4_9BACL|nr:Na+/H+ antiporter subunit D [Chryseomicrobium excrementi]PJK16635.1 Na+/H+ antiporter subunit D [Chryseomicrobium excrementi]